MKTERQKDALRIIYDHFKKNGEYPSNIRMAKILKISTNKWGNTRRLMIANNKLIESMSGDFELHPDVLENLRQKEQQFGKLQTNESQVESAEQLKLPERTIVEKPKASKQIKSERKGNLRPSAREVTPISIAILGEVQAGTDLGPDDLRVYSSSDGEPLILPDVEPGQELFALEVIGESMRSDNILPEDFIVVENVGIGQIKVGDLIVARYLKKKFNRVDKSRIDEIRHNSENYDGPTVKYLIKMEQGAGYTLAPKNRDPRYTIFTRDIKEDEIGRVVAVHRTIRRL